MIKYKQDFSLRRVWMFTPEQYMEMKKKKRQRWPGKGYFIILFTTIILLVALTASLFVILAIDDDDIGEKPQNTGKEPATNTNKSALYPTVPSRSSYLSTSAGDAALIGDNIRSNNAILVELGGYTSIAEKGADQPIYPASMTKVMTLIVACENVTSLNKKLVVTQEDIDYKDQNGGSGLLVASSLGDGFTIEDLLYMISYKSDTIACLMIAKEIAGSEAKFVEMMNDKADELGLTKTNFKNCTGLHHTEHVTTCREMAAMMSYALENQLAKRILLSTDVRKIPAYVGNSNEPLVNYWAHCEWYSVRFNSEVELNTVTVRAAKTGYTDEAGVCLVSYAVSKTTGKGYVNVIVGQPKGSGLSESISTQEVKNIYNAYAK